MRKGFESSVGCEWSSSSVEAGKARRYREQLGDRQVQGRKHMGLSFLEPAVQQADAQQGSGQSLMHFSYL